MPKLELGFQTTPAVISEMSKDGAGSIDVPVAEGLIESVSADDKNPMFVTIEVINEGVSRNGRAYDRATILSIAEQINSKKPDGYYGHLTDEERKTKYPEPQTIWLGARVEEVGGKLRLFAKGYVLPEARGLRSYLKKAKAVGKNVAVSIYGTASVVKDRTKNVLNIKALNLESIDWARPGSEGVLNMGMFHVAAEMHDSNLDKGDDMTKEEALKNATVDELKELNPTIVSEMTTIGASEKEAELAEVVSEMTSVREALGLEDGVSTVETVKEMTEKLNGLTLDSELREKVDSSAARSVIKKLVVSEMAQGKGVTEAVDTVLGSETGQAVIKEMIDTAPRVTPLVDRPSGVARKYTKKG